MADWTISEFEKDGLEDLIFKLINEDDLQLTKDDRGRFANLLRFISAKVKVRRSRNNNPICRFEREVKRGERKFKLLLGGKPSDSRSPCPPSLLRLCARESI